ncbi:MAG: NADP-dependent oxidoreductase [Ilumatobacteraceae bacterium]
MLASRPTADPRPEHFEVRELQLPDLGAGQLLVRNVAMSVDPSMRGRLETSEKQYTTNFQVDEPLDGSALGRVLESNDPGVAVGAYVRHRMGWRNHAVIDASSATTVDPAVAPLGAWLGVLGQTGFTAWVGLTRIGRLAEGETLFVSAAAGAVGSAAGQFARLLGAGRIVGSAGGADKVRLLTEELGFDDAFDYRSEDPMAAVARTAPDGVDVYFDNVGGRHLVAAINHMNLQGRVALCGMISMFDESAPKQDINQLIQTVLRRITVQGFIVRDHEDLRSEFETTVGGWLNTNQPRTARRSWTDSTTPSRGSCRCSAVATSARCSSGWTKGNSQTATNETNTTHETIKVLITRSSTRPRTRARRNLPPTPSPPCRPVRCRSSSIRASTPRATESS